MSCGRTAHGRWAVRNRTAQANEIHGFLLEYGIESSKRGALLPRLAEVLEDVENELSYQGRALLRELGDELRRLDARVKWFDTQIAAIAAQEPACQRLSAIPGIGVLTATALVAAVGDAAEFKNGQEMAAWLGLVPRQHSTGGRPTLLGGEQAWRPLPAHAAGARRAVGADRRREAVGPAQPLGARTAGATGMEHPVVALANKNARAAWAVLARGAEFDAAHISRAA